MPPETGCPRSPVRPARGKGSRDHVLAVAGHDEQAAGPDPLQHVERLHRTDRDMLDHASQVAARVEHVARHLLDQHRQRRVRQQRPVRQHAEQLDAVSSQPALERQREARVRLVVDLVDDRTHHLDAVSVEQRAIEDDLVDRAADAGLAHDQRAGAEHPSHVGVGEPDDRADTGVAGALDQDDLATTADTCVCVADAGRQVVHDITGDERLREATGDVDGAQRVGRIRQPEDALHEDRVLVDRLSVDHAVALPDRLDEPGLQPAADERGEQAERDRRLAAVLARGREIDLAHGT
jgi:hypothetical protein